MKPRSVTDQDFEHVLKDAGQRPVLVDFWAPWCAPCRMMSPVLEQVQSELADDAWVLKMNTDENPRVPGALGIRALPTLLMFQDGEIVDVLVGVQSAKKLIKGLKKRVAKAA